MRHCLSIVFICILGLAAWGCSTSEPGSGSDLVGAEGNPEVEPPSISTLLDPSSMHAGESSTVSCRLNVMGFQDGADAVFTVEPSDGVVVEGERVTIERAGDYTVRCEHPELELVDEVGAVLTVTPSDATTVTAMLEASVVEVFESTNVMCTVLDTYGNAIDGFETFVVAPEEVMVTDHEVSSEVVGSHEIACDVEGDLTGSLESVADTLKVTASAPAVIELGVTPELESYSVGQMVDLYWVVRDEHGNQILGLPVQVDVPEANIEVIDEEDHKYRLLTEGLYPFQVTLAPPHEAVTAQRTLVVDESGPEIIVTWPSRGETVLGEGDFLTIEGSVVDAFGAVTSFEIGGVPVSLQADGSFETVVLPHWGVNLINAMAQDEYGNISKLSPSYQYSSSYLDYEDKQLEDVIQEDGLELLIGQEFLDDGDHDPTNVDDLATILEVVLSDLNITDLLGGFGGFPVLDLPIDVFDLNLGILQIGVGGSVQVNIAIVEPTDIGPVMVTLDSRLGGIDSGIEFGTADEKGLQVALEVTLDFNIGLTISSFLGTWNPNLSAQVVLDSEVSIDNLLLATKIDIQKVAGGELYVDLVQLDNEIVNLQLDPIDDIELGFTVDLDVPLIPAFDLNFKLSDLFDLTSLTDQILDPITQDFVPLLIEFTEPLIEEFADDILKQLLLALELQTTLPLPELLGPQPEPVELGLATALSRVEFTDDGGQIGLAMGLHAESQVDAAPLGSIKRAGCLEAEEDIFFYDWDRSFGGAVKTDVINAGIFAAWRSGFLNGPLDLGALAGGLGDTGGFPIPLDDMELQLTWTSPPVLNDCGGKGILQLEMGDLLVGLDANLLGSEVSAVMYVDAAISLFFGASEEGLSVTVGDFAFLDVEIIEYEESGSGLIDIKDLLENQLYGLLSGLIVGQSFGPLALPPLALGDFAPGLPAEAVLNLGNLSITKDDGYVVLGADLL
ncbi:MAG: hypothetical protein ACPGU1_05785 [Myxococcota bacterium]